MRILGLSLLICVALVGAAHASFINYSTREINVKVVYYGSLATTAATDNLTYVYNKTNPDSKGKLIRLATDQGDSTLFFDFLPLSLGEIRGFKTRFHLYTVVTAKEYAASRALILKGVDGIVFIADADPASAQINQDSLTELKELLKQQGYDFDKVPIVFQIVGTSKKGAVSVADLTKSLAIGNRLVFEADPTTGAGVFTTLKAIAKLVLMELRTPTPPAKTPANTKPKAKPAARTAP